MFNINELFSKRIGGNNYLNNSSINKINRLKKMKEDIRNKEEILDFDFNRQNIESNTIDYNKVLSGYLRVEHSLEIDSKSEIILNNGFKDTLSSLLLAFTNKDDYIITTSPGNNEISDMAKMLECNVYEYNLVKFNKYLIDFEDIDESILKKCKLLYINYPNDPTGAIATKDFFKEVVKYAKKYNFIVVHDATYIDYCYDDVNKISFLSVEGAKEVGIELYSFLMSFNIRDSDFGFMVGNKNIIKAYSYINETLKSIKPIILKDDYIKSINNYETINKQLKEIYLTRHKKIKEILEKHGFKSEIPKAGIYQYISVPKSCNGVMIESAEEFSLWLMENDSIITIPYDKAGKYVRLSMCFDLNCDIEEISHKLDEKLAKYKFEF